MLGNQKRNIDPVLKEWLQEFLNPNTKNTYKSALTKYMKLLNIESLEDYLNSNPNPISDLKRFLVAMNGKPSKTVKSYANAVKLFLNEKGHKIENEDWKKLTRRGYIPRRARPTTQDKKPSKEIMRKILTHSNVKGRALFLFLISSGCRIGETLQILIEDMELDANPPKAHIRDEYTKGGASGRTVYFSHEARDAIREWLKVKGHWKKRTAGGTHGGNRVFPWTSQTAGFMLRLACDKAEVGDKDKKTQRRIYHLHSLRKFFRSNSGLGFDVVNALMGHEQYLDAFYLRLEENEEIAEVYLEAMPNLSMFTVEDKTLVKKTESLEEENVELKKRVKYLESQTDKIEQMEKENSNMEDRMRKLEGLLLDMGKAVSEMRKGN